MHERISDRPRIILPGPRYLLLGPGRSVTAELVPQFPMYPPYWFGMIAMEDLHVTEIRFGNEQVFGSIGAVPSQFFDVRKVECLIPITAKQLGPGERILIEVDNWSCASVQTSLAVWGSHHPQRLPDSNWSSDELVAGEKNSPSNSSVKLLSSQPTYWR